MIEAPEAVNLAAQLNTTVKGKRIETVVTAFTPHKFAFFSGDPEGYDKVLLGKKITGAVSYGGMVELKAEDAHIVFTDGVNLTYIEPGGKLPAKHQFLLGFDDESCLVVSIRMYGGILVFCGDSFEAGLWEYYEVARNKPQVLSDDFTEEYFRGLINAPDAPVKSAKAFLATGQTIPGLGNGVLQDILYNACIHPKTKIKELSEGKKSGMYKALRSTLSEMTAMGGRNSETDLFGSPGGYKPFLSKDTVGEHCVRCGDIIMKESYMGGAIYYCPGCQK